MFRILEINDDSKQKHTLGLSDGTSLVLILEYKPMQLGWFITQLKYKDFEINGLRVVTSPNLIHQFHTQLPFGIACFVTANQEPTLQQDFLSERAQMFILSKAEVSLYEQVLSGG